MCKIGIIGAGPAGIYCAIKLLELSEKFEITVFDKKDPLATLLPTGNFRCNLTFNEPDYREFASNYPRGEKFLYSIFSRYSCLDTISDFEKLGIKTYTQEDYRVFPVSNSSSFVRKKLLEKIQNKVKFEKADIKEKLEGFDAAVLASGLKSYPKIAESYGHKIMPVKPALYGLKIKEYEKFSRLKGVSFNDIIFTNFGISGPYIFKLSSINAYKEFPYEIKIPLIKDFDALFDAINKNPKKLFKTVVSYFIPKAMAEVLIEKDIQCANISKKDVLKLDYLTLTAISPDNNGEIVHAGGVSLNEIDKNLKSKICSNLWIIGELLDVDGFCGGFNLQNCWSTAAIAALDISKKFM